MGTSLAATHEKHMLPRRAWKHGAGGLAFDGFFFEGEDYGDRGDNRIDVKDGPLAGASVTVRF